MNHFFYPGRVSKEIVCAHCNRYVFQIPYNDLIGECKGERPFAYATDTHAINMRKSWAAIWKNFTVMYPYFKSIDDESYHEGSYRRDPDMLKNFIPRVLVIPESIVPSLQCYKEHTHKLKEMQNTHACDREGTPYERFDDRVWGIQRAYKAPIPATERREDYLIPFRVKGTDTTRLAELSSMYWEEKRKGYLGDNW